jgi:outer membrane biosynthesis protein TonB
MDVMGGRRQRWSVSGLTSMGAHGALVTACLLWSIQHPPRARDQRPTEFEVHSVPPVVLSVPPPRAAAAPAVRGRARPVRGSSLRPTAPIPISREEAALTAPTSGVPEGDEDRTFDSVSPSTLVATGPPGGTAPPTTETGIAPLEAAYLCTYQSLRGLPRSLYVRGRVYRLLVQMCIGSDGRVEAATLEKGATAELDSQVLVDMRQWRYRPRIVHGKPSAFCYKVRVSYEVD